MKRVVAFVAVVAVGAALLLAAWKAREWQCEGAKHYWACVLLR